ncbi:MAG: hypothetical protein PVJ80_05245 [Gemmatimonadota bacterium]|jgi:hypothetical protein
MSEHSDYRRGLRGESPLSAKDTFAWAAGDAARKHKQVLEDSPLKGESDPNAWQIFILLGTVAALLRVLFELELLPSILTASWWRLGAAWLVPSTCAYFVLKAIPAWLAGSIMGLGLGGTAAYVGWVLLSPLWAAVSGLGVGALMYLAFSRLK